MLRLAITIIHPTKDEIFILYHYMNVGDISKLTNKKRHIHSTKRIAENLLDSKIIIKTTLQRQEIIYSLELLVNNLAEGFSNELPFV